MAWRAERIEARAERKEDRLHARAAVAMVTGHPVKVSVRLFCACRHNKSEWMCVREGVSVETAAVCNVTVCMLGHNCLTHVMCACVCVPFTFVFFFCIKVASSQQSLLCLKTAR